MVGQSEGMPRWVKVSGLTAIVVLVLLVVGLLLGAEHGPGRHFGGLAPTEPARASVA